MKKFNSELEVYEEMAKYENKSIGEIAGVSNNFPNKSYVGHIIEEKIFGYKPNSKSAPDLENLDLEIKSTPVKKVNNRYVSKERLVLNIINYCNENWDNIYESTFWRKNKNLLIVFYEYFFDKKPYDYKLIKSIIYKYPTDDFKIILNDWNTISKKVLEGKAHEISEKDTLYLAACTKGANSDSVQKQPYSSLLAKQRAYSLKSSYMTTIFNEYVLGNKKNEKIINESIINEIFDIYRYIREIFTPYFGKTTTELIHLLGIESKIDNKAINSMIIKKIIGINGSLDKIDEFNKAGIIPKTIRLEVNGSIKESMSFPTFNFKEIIRTEWEDSDIFNILSNQQFLFIIFQKVYNSNEYKLLNIMFWSMPESDLNECKHVYNRTKKIIEDGVVITEKRNITINNLPGSKESLVMHVRPHAQNKYDTDELPDGRLLTKQCFWLNSGYVKKVINKE